ncbi:hypothetical protein Ais01nite_15900 [Asanoa ishikariensis]|uniref:DUF2470 domain-containing protein n=1 Tax=Asanoa ishikariensis TaxID=137265 RepID=A0A1H3UGL2_9ACTN|nr:DUF2470 domain-containing protein [Asanoa ishikariensis]GIF63555.1 hypothetical protein Ais01nite_15900 [Asanoa ishikariensis]SDZ61622.1 hypothetical protein SAMN05421684_7284 [Asanoa ishikariensis]
MPPDASRMSDGVPATDAVAARSVLALSSSLLLCTDGTASELVAAHAVLPDGSVALAVDAMTPIGGQLVAARGRPGGVRLQVTSVVPVRVRCRVRARVTVTGTVRALDPAALDGCDANTVASLLDLPPVALWAVEPVGVHIERHSTSGDVSVSDYRAASPDPVAAVEAAFLHQLDIERLTLPAGWRLPSPSARLVPVAIDSDGLTVRAETRQEHRDVRLPFASRVTTEDELARELAVLAATDPATLRPRAARPDGIIVE